MCHLPSLKQNNKHVKQQRWSFPEDWKISVITVILHHFSSLFFQISQLQIWYHLSLITWDGKCIGPLKPKFRFIMWIYPQKFNKPIELRTWWTCQKPVENLLKVHNCTPDFDLGKFINLLRFNSYCSNVSVLLVVYQKSFLARSIRYLAFTHYVWSCK